MSREHFRVCLRAGKLLVEACKNRHPILFRGEPTDRFTLAAGQEFASAHTLFQLEESKASAELTFTLHLKDLTDGDGGHAQRCLAALLQLQPVLSVWREPRQFFAELLPLLRAVAPEATSLQAYRADDLSTPLHQLGLAVPASRTLLRSALNGGESVFHLWDNRSEPGLEPTVALGINWALASPIQAVTEQFILYVVGMQESGSGSGLPGQQDRALVALMAKLVSQYFASCRTAQLQAEVEAERRQRQLSDQLRSLTSRLSESLRLEDTCQCLLQALKMAAPHEDAAIFLRDDRHFRPILTPPAGRENQWEGFPLDRIAPRVGGEVSAVRLSDQAWLALFSRARAPVEGLLLPLRLRNQAGALIALAHPLAWSDRDIDLLVLLASQAPVALQNSHLYSKMERMAVTDELTGVFSRRQFFQLADRQWRRARQHTQPFWAMLMDVDHFKSFNDRYGHQVGDAVLRHTALLCQQLLGRDAVFARCGGEEFAAVSLTPMLEGAERLRAGLEKTPLVFEGQSYTILASFGVSQNLPRDQSLADLLKRADEALYEAKQAGRIWSNCIQVEDYLEK